MADLAPPMLPATTTAAPLPHTGAGIPPLQYATPAPARQRAGPALVLIAGFFTLVLTVLPWGITFAAMVGEVRPRGGSDAVLAIAVVFGALGLLVTVVGLWMMIAAARRLLR